MTATLTARSVAETEAAAARLAPELRGGDVVALYGPLGAGKSTFARALVRALTGDAEEEVPSPTFTLVQEYAAGDGTPLWHMDLYRLDEPEEVLELGFDEALEDAILLIEWPERLGPLLPADRLEVTISQGPDESRCIRFEGHGNWAQRTSALQGD